MESFLKQSKQIVKLQQLPRPEAATLAVPLLYLLGGTKTQIFSSLGERNQMSSSINTE